MVSKDTGRRPETLAARPLGLSEDSETLELVDPETRRRMDTDPMFRVEKTLRQEPSVIALM